MSHRPRQQVLIFGGTIASSATLVQVSTRIRRPAVIVRVSGQGGTALTHHIDVLILYAPDNNLTGVFTTLGTDIRHPDTPGQEFEIFNGAALDLPMYLPIPAGSFIKVQFVNEVAAISDVRLYVTLEELLDAGDTERDYGM